MRKIAIAALGFALLVSGAQLFAESASDTEKMLQTKEQSGWQAWKDHDMKPFEEMIPENSINIAGGAVDKGKQQIIKGATDPGCKVNSFSLTDFSYIWLDKDTVIMTYNAAQDATCGGKKIPDKVVASSVWQRKGGKWVSPFHQETPAPGM